MYCPWVKSEYLGSLAGSHVDIRSVKATEAVSEALKYTAKIISPLSGAWVGGERRRVIHPELAAHWQIAARAKRLRAVRGRPLRVALSATGKSSSEPPAERELECAVCGVALPRCSGVVRSTHEVAREQHELQAKLIESARIRYTFDRITFGELVAESRRFDEHKRIHLRTFLWRKRLHLR